MAKLLFCVFGARLLENKKALEAICLKDERVLRAVVPLWFARFLTKAAFKGAITLLRCVVRTRRDLCIRGRPRNSETMFPRPFRVSSHQSRLSVPYLYGYSSLHRLWV